jgi:hypothetical protein
LSNRSLLFSIILSSARLLAFRGVARDDIAAGAMYCNSRFLNEHTK